MMERFQEPVQLSEGINLRELLTSETEFKIDMDFNRPRTEMFFNGDDDIYPDLDLDEDESDDEDVLKNIEESTEKMMLASPEYVSFNELAPKMIDCDSQGDVKIMILEEGNGPLVPVDAEVTIHYAAYWEKAKVPFDSTLTMNGGTPLHVRLGRGRALVGLERGLCTVRGPHARLLLLLRPAVTWGPRGVPPRILPQTALFVVVLYDVKDDYAATRFNDLPSEEQGKFEVTMRTVKALRLTAKDLFVKKKYMKAIRNYQQAISVLNVSRPNTEQEVKEVKSLKVKMYVNLAVCYYRMEKPKQVLKMCECLDRIIDIETHCKALYYYGRAYEMSGKTDIALTYYKKALKLEPKNKEIGKTLADIDVKSKMSAVNEKEMWQKALMSEPVESKVVYDVDEDFQNGVLGMCQDLTTRGEFSKFDLPTGLTKNEVDCIKGLVSTFEGLVVDESGEGKRKKVTIIKKV